VSFDPGDLQLERRFDLVPDEEGDLLDAAGIQGSRPSRPVASPGRLELGEGDADLRPFPRLGFELGSVGDPVAGSVHTEPELV
jgi:hypothetical protein